MIHILIKCIVMLSIRIENPKVAHYFGLESDHESDHFCFDYDFKIIISQLLFQNHYFKITISNVTLLFSRLSFQDNYLKMSIQTNYFRK